MWCATWRPLGSRCAYYRRMTPRLRRWVANETAVAVGSEAKVVDEIVGVEGGVLAATMLHELDEKFGDRKIAAAEEFVQRRE